MEKKRFPLIKTDERTSGGRVYTRKSVEEAMKRIRWDSYVPLCGIDRTGMQKEYTMLRKDDFFFDTNAGILYVSIKEDIIPRINGLSLVPYIYVESVRTGKEEAIIHDFVLNGVHAVQDLCSFKSIDSLVKL